MTAAQGPSEDDLIARYFRPLASAAGAFGLTDDAAVLNGSLDDLVITTDAIVEGIHFLPDDPPDTIARKALRVNLSDLAAKGAEPAGFVLTLALREAIDSWLNPFSKALGEDASLFGCPLLGGDTVSTPGPLMISITAFGGVPPNRMVRRRGAKVGDRVVVTGTIGDAALGLAMLRPGSSAGALTADAATQDALVARYRVPQPRTALALAVREHASAAMDVSDGLAGDLTKLCAASGVSAEIELSRVPLSSHAQAVLKTNATSLEALISGGDDYEILCTVADSRLASFMRAADHLGIAATVIGVIRGGAEPVQFIGADGQDIALKRRSYSHF